MARKIFISYKHKDKDVKFMLGKLQGTRPSDYAHYLRDYTFPGDSVHEEAKGDEDLRGYSQEYLQQRLRAKLQDIDLLLVLITPWMLELGRDLWEQWLPQEINYALGGSGDSRKTIVAIVLPDRSGSYSYYQRELQQGQLPSILAANIKNGYIHVSEWDSFKSFPNVALYGADLRKENTTPLVVPLPSPRIAL